MEGLTTIITGFLTDIEGLITGNLPAILGVAGLILGAFVIWRLVKRFVR